MKPSEPLNGIRGFPVETVFRTDKEVSSKPVPGDVTLERDTELRSICVFNP